MDISKEERDRMRGFYIARKGVVCPFEDCQSHDIHSRPKVDVGEDGRAVQEAYCCKCGREWVDEYTLTGLVFKDEIESVRESMSID